jgi:hypothetical protein
LLFALLELVTPPLTVALLLPEELQDVTARTPTVAAAAVASARARLIGHTSATR